LFSGSELTPSRVDWCHGAVDQFGDQSAGRILKLPLRMRMKKAGQQIAAVLGSAGRRREAHQRARSGLRLVGSRREGPATRVGGSCGPRRGAWRTQSIPAVRVIFRTPIDATRLTCLGNERAIPAYFLTPTEQIATGQNRYGIINHPVRLN